jgi:hypothetical protein
MPTMMDVYTVKVVCEGDSFRTLVTIPDREQMLLAKKVRRDRRSFHGDTFDVEEVLQRAAILALLSLDTDRMDKHFKGKPYTVTEVRGNSQGDLFYNDLPIQFE